VRLRALAPVATHLALRARGEGLGAHRRECLVGAAELVARVRTPALAAQPFAVEETSARERQAHAGAAEPVDRLAVEALG